MFIEKILKLRNRHSFFVWLKSWNLVRGCVKNLKKLSKDSESVSDGVKKKMLGKVLL